MLWAASGSAAKYLFQSGVTPFQLVQLRTTLASAGLFVSLLILRRPLLRIEKKDLIYFLVLGVVLAISQLTYLYAISSTNVAVAILLQYLSPVLIALYTIMYLRVRPNVFAVMAIAGALFGCYLMAGAYRLDLVALSRAGIISGLTSAFTFAVYTLRSEYAMRKYSAWTVVFYALFFASLFWNIFHPPMAAFLRDYSLSVWGLVFFVGIVGTVFPFLLYTEGVRLIKATHASVTATLEPVIAGGLAYVFLGEILELWQIIGGGLVVSSVLLLQTKGRSKQ